MHNSCSTLSPRRKEEESECLNCYQVFFPQVDVDSIQSNWNLFGVLVSSIYSLNSDPSRFYPCQLDYESNALVITLIQFNDADIFTYKLQKSDQVYFKFAHDNLQVSEIFELFNLSFYVPN